MHTLCFRFSELVEPGWIDVDGVILPREPTLDKVDHDEAECESSSGLLYNCCTKRPNSADVDSNILACASSFFVRAAAFRVHDEAVQIGDEESSIEL